MVPTSPVRAGRGAVPSAHLSTCGVPTSSQSLGKKWKEGEARVPALKQLRACPECGPAVMLSYQAPEGGTTHSGGSHWEL